ncbi:MAG: TatD family hydrolase [Candidatus Nanosalina sp.]
MKPVDAHCHVYFDQFSEDRDKVLERAKGELEFIGLPGVNPDTNQKVINLSEKHGEFVSPHLGLHPVYTDSFSQIEEVKKQIREQDPDAIGEIGLDHHHVTDEAMREKQEKVFRQLLELAENLGKTVVVHSREAEDRAVEIINQYNLSDVFMHCFNGSPELAEKAAVSGMKIGATTQVLYSGRVENTVERLELEDMILETDSPYLYRGDRNEPVNVVESAKKIAEIKNSDREEVISKTTENSREIFHR